MFRVNVRVASPSAAGRESQPIEVLVDTGSEQNIQRDIGYAILRSEGFETIDEVIFAEPSDMSLLGVRTLEGFGVMVDNIAHRFVATTTLAV